jgi:hypothetical protein
MGRLLCALVAGAVLSLPATGVASAAKAPKPDAHDRAVAAQLVARLVTFEKLTASTKDSSDLQSALQRCPAVGKSPSKVLAAAFSLFPALLIQIVNEYGPQLRDLRTMLASMHADAPLFQQWLHAEHDDLSLILEFDNHGKKIDLCKAATVMLDNKSTPADVQNVLGIDPAIIGQVFTSPVSGTLTKIEPRVRVFLIAAGVSARNAKRLTSD